MKILVVEDNPRLATRLQSTLKKQFVVDVCHTGDAALEAISESTFDVALLDLGLPDIQGSELCKHIRHLSKEIAIIVVTGVDTVESKVDLLTHGADDYIVKPFNAAELQARVATQIRRVARADYDAVIEIGDLTINTSNRRVKRAGVEIKLRRKEFDILECLALNPGRIMSRDNIVNHAWSSTSSSWTGSVDVHIKQLRDKIDKPFPVTLIKTAYGLGYMMDPGEA